MQRFTHHGFRLAYSTWRVKHWIEVTSHLLACLIVQNNHLTINSSMPNKFHIRSLLAVALVMKLYSTASKLKGSRTTAKTRDKSNVEVSEHCIGFQCLQYSLSTFRFHITAAWWRPWIIYTKVCQLPLAQENVAHTRIDLSNGTLWCTWINGPCHDQNTAHIVHECLCELCVPHTCLYIHSVCVSSSHKHNALCTVCPYHINFMFDVCTNKMTCSPDVRLALTVYLSC